MSLTRRRAWFSSSAVPGCSDVFPFLVSGSGAWPRVGCQGLEDGACLTSSIWPALSRRRVAFLRGVLKECLESFGWGVFRLLHVPRPSVYRTLSSNLACHSGPGKMAYALVSNRLGPHVSCGPSVFMWRRASNHWRSPNAGRLEDGFQVTVQEMRKTVDILWRLLPGRPGSAKPGGRALARALGLLRRKSLQSDSPLCRGWFLCGLVLGESGSSRLRMCLEHFRDGGRLV